MAYCEKVSYNLTGQCHCNVLGKIRGQTFSNSTQVTDMEEACPTCFGHVFL